MIRSVSGSTVSPGAVGVVTACNTYVSLVMCVSVTGARATVSVSRSSSVIRVCAWSYAAPLSVTIIPTVSTVRR